MTRRTNARLAGLLFLLYIVTGLASMALFDRATGGAEGAAATLASLTQHVTTVRLTVVLSLLMFLYAAGLGVTLWALTRDEDRDLAMLALCCRVTEGVLAAASAFGMLELLSVATAASGAAAAEVTAANALGAALLEQNALGMPVTAFCFALGSTLFSWLFLRARTIPVALARLGVFASILLVVLLPAQLAGWIGAPVTLVMWLPMLVFEVALALWLLIKGVAGDGPESDARHA
jgi:hypothetical protein